MRWACASARLASGRSSCACPPSPGEPGVVASRGHFPATLGAAVRQKARWLGGIAFAGWDRLGWRGGLGERWFRLRDRRGPLCRPAAARRLRRGPAVGAAVARGPARRAAAAAALAAARRPAPDQLRPAPVENPHAYRLHHPCLRPRGGAGLGAADRHRQPHRHPGHRPGPVPHAGGGPKQWDKTDHVFPKAIAPSAEPVRP
jgi:adsorption protein B